MGVSFASYEIARSGMFVNERGLFVTGHNISNANTAGYVRQQAIMTTAPYITENGKYQYGLGADIDQIRQIRNTFLDNIFRQENTTLGYWESRNKTFQDVQAIMGEPMGAGLQNVLNQFWDSWQELSKNPESLTVRALVRQRGESLVQQLNHEGSQLDKLQDDLNSEIGVRIEEVNQITKQIASLNQQIVQVEVSGDTANDYRDQRNVLVDRLTQLADVDVTEMKDGQLDITLGGYFLVTKGIQKNIYAAESQAQGRYYVPKLVGDDIEVKLKSGIIKGLMESRGEVLGSVGSIQNGTPNTKADIVFAVDISNSSAGYLADVKANIQSYVDELKKSGVDYNLRLITYGDNVISNNSYGTDATTLIGDIPAVPAPDTGNNFGSAGGVIEALEGITNFRTNANKYAMVFTGESIDGDGGVAVTDATSYINRLKNIGVTTSVVTNSGYFSTGDPSEVGWDSIASGTGGQLYDINTPAANYAAMMTTMASDTKDSVNKTISNVQQSTNVVSDVKKKLNALVNVVLREINYLHKSGKTLGNPPSDGDDFFVAIDPNLPLQMGNIKLNDNLLSLNSIVASASGDNGDNSIALKIANLRYDPMMNGAKGVLSVDDYYQQIILDVGNEGSNAQNICDNQQKLVQSADSYRKSVTGVSMDEEMTNMMKYQYAYSAAARVINVIDEMTQSIISRMGLVGR